MPDTPSAPPTRPVRRPLRARVEQTEQLTPHMIRVVLGGDDLQAFPAGAFSDHYVKLLFPAPGAPYGMVFDVEQVRAELPREQWPRTRTYSVRAWDPERVRLTVDFVHHGDTGVAGPWAANAQPGDEIQLLGPGGAYLPDPDAAWHLLVGDASVVPAISASLERMPAGVPVHVVLEVEDAAEELPLPTAADLHVTWLHRRGGTGEGLLPAVAALDFPAGTPQVFVHGEANAVRALRKHLLVDRALPREALSISGYWKQTLTEDGWQASKAEWNREVEQDVA